MQRIEVNLEELLAILERAKPHVTEEQYTKLFDALQTLNLLTVELEKKKTTARQLRKLLFGSQSEKTKDVLSQTAPTGPQDNPSGGQPSPGSEDAQSSGGKEKEPKKKPKGHGRNGTGAYRGATVQFVAHPSLKRKDPCPDCRRGKLYPQKPVRIVRLKGQAPIGGTLYELERLRCHSCGAVFTAPAPQNMGQQVGDETAKSMVALLKYGCGFPFNRLDRLQASLGIPLPKSNQWEWVEELGNTAQPVYKFLLPYAADGEVVHNDDTKARILSVTKEIQAQTALGDPPERTGIFTTGIVSIRGDQKIALFFTGRNHAGENLETVLKGRKRAHPPIQMCDGLDRNLPKSLKTILANCLCHARRKFVDVVESFPAEVEHLLLELGKVYKHEEQAVKQHLSPEQRLRFHRQESGPIMDALKIWLSGLLDDRKVEPNSTLGDAIKYMLKRWDAMTLFLRMPGAPLDNNLCERVLKIAILNRKNALFYKTENGAKIGDILTSLIATCMLAKLNAYKYFCELLRNAEHARSHPELWLPWNYPDPTAPRA